MISICCLLSLMNSDCWIWIDNHDEDYDCEDVSDHETVVVMIILMLVKLILMMTSKTMVMMLIGVMVIAIVVMVVMVMRVFTSLAVPSPFPPPRILFFCFGFVQTIWLGRFKLVWCKYSLEHWSRSLQDSSLQLAGRLVLHHSCSSDLNVVWNN